MTIVNEGDEEYADAASDALNEAVDEFNETGEVLTPRERLQLARTYGSSASPGRCPTSPPCTAAKCRRADCAAIAQ